MERDLTTGSIGRNILKFSLPYFLSYFLQTLYGMADLFIIGQFNGVASTTAVSIGSQVMHMITVMIVGIAMGTTVMIGKSVGAKQKKETSKIIGNTVSLFVCLSVVSRNLFPPTGNLSPEMKIRKAMRIARERALRIFIPGVLQVATVGISGFLQPER